MIINRIIDDEPSETNSREGGTESALGELSGVRTTRRRAIRGVCTLATAGGLAVASGTVAAQSEDGDWPQYHGGVQRRGRTSMADPEKPSRVRWSTGVGLNQMHPVVAGRTVYFGDKSGNLQARDLGTGELHWRYSASGPVQLAPAVRDGRVYIGTRAGYLRAIDTGSGEEQWSRRLPGKFTSTPVVTDDRVYIGFTRRVDRFNAEHGVHAFGAESGDPLWTFSQGADENGIRDQPSGRPTPAVSGGTLVVNLSTSDPNNRARGLATSDGSVVWTESFHGRENAMGGLFSPPALGESAGYILSEPWGACRFSIANGSTNWKQSGDSNYPPTIGDDRVFTVHRESSSLMYRGLNPVSGAVAWTYPTSRVASGITTTGGRVYLVADTNLVALRAGDGIERWTFELPTSLGEKPRIAASDPVITPEGILVNHRGTLYLVDSGGDGSPTPSEAVTPADESTAAAGEESTAGGLQTTPETARSLDSGTRPERGFFSNGDGSPLGGLSGDDSVTVASIVVTIVSMILSFVQMVRGQ
jgi:outer membrane protein assembly factor BamB